MEKIISTYFVIYDVDGVAKIAIEELVETALTNMVMDKHGVHRQDPT